MRVRWASLWQSPHFRPAILPDHGRDLEERPASRPVVGVEYQVVAARFLQDDLMARAFPVRCGRGDHQAAAAFRHGLPILVYVGPGDFAGASYYHVVSAGYAAAAAVERYKQVEIVAMPDDERGLHRAADGLRPVPAGERIHLRVPGGGDRKRVGQGKGVEL